MRIAERRLKLAQDVQDAWGVLQKIMDEPSHELRPSRVRPFNDLLASFRQDHWQRLATRQRNRLKRLRAAGGRSSRVEARITLLVPNGTVSRAVEIHNAALHGLDDYIGTSMRSPLILPVLLILTGFAEQVFGSVPVN